MNQDIKNASEAISKLANAVQALNGNQTQSITEIVGWFGPAVSLGDLVKLNIHLADEINKISEEVYTNNSELIKTIPSRIDHFINACLPYFFNGHGGQAFPAYFSTLFSIQTLLIKEPNWETLDSKALPSGLVKRARSAQTELDQLIPNISGLSEQIRQIQAAHEVAENLPTDLAGLESARKQTVQAQADLVILAEKVKAAHDDAIKNLDSITNAKAATDKLVEKCEEAYRITTTKGLAAAFEERAMKLDNSLKWWVVGLSIALAMAGLIGWVRLSELSTALNNPTINWAKIVVQTVFSLVSVGAPIWFAWLSTKQIGQLFKLAEDYAFKASVSKAYEGYRKEAVNLDAKFQAQLFNSALTRLDEEPLRFIDAGSHGSPWHELANSDMVKKAFNVAPELQDKAMILLREAVSAVKSPVKTEITSTKTE